MPAKLMPASQPSSTNSAGTQPPAVKSPPKPKAGDLTVDEIIAKARAVPRFAPARGAFAASLTTAGLLWASFTPLDFGPLAWIALVPILLLVRIPQRTRWMYAAVYLGGLTFFIPTLQWMRLGDPAMYIAWGALSVYAAMYFPVFVWLSRVAVHRLAVPFTLAVPVVWVALEYLRAYVFTGFSWYYLGHSQYRFVELIQISDITGAYGVSFVVALSAAILTGLMPLNVFERLRLLPAVGTEKASPKQSAHAWVPVLFGTLVFAAVLGYGVFRRNNVEFEAGPRMALVQGNFTTSLKHDPTQAQKIFYQHHFLTGQAVKLGHKPDVIVWPETMYRSPLLSVEDNLTDQELSRIVPQVPPARWRSAETQTALHNLSEQAGAALIIGVDSAVANRDGMHRFNSAAFVQQSLGVTNRYDKIHRVIFGEYIPLREEIPWLRSLTPFSEGFGINAGQEAKIFQTPDFNFAPIICYEDTVPHLVRGIVNSADEKDRSVDVLVNLTNDGWFHGSSELNQHLITSQFRAVECRTPVVRAVNTGISAFIDGDGVVIEPEVFFDADEQGRDSMRDPETGQYHKQLNAVLIHDVPLDPRESWYVKHGDWFAGGCGLCAVFVFIAGVWPFRKEPTTAWTPPAE